MDFLENLQAFKTALAAVQAASASIPKDELTEDDWNSVQRRMKYIASDLKRLIKDAWVSQQALGAIESLPEPVGVISEAGARFSKDTRSQLTNMYAVLKAMLDTEDASDENKAEAKASMEEAVKAFDVIADAAEACKKAKKKPMVEAMMVEDPPFVGESHMSWDLAYVFSEAEGSKPAEHQHKMLVIKEGLSGNKVNYSRKMLAESVKLLDRRPIYINHPTGITEGKPQPRGIETKAGWWSDPVWVEGLQLKQSDGSVKVVNGIVATANVLESGPNAWLGPMIKEARERGVPDIVGVSIIAGGKFEMRKAPDGTLYREALQIDRYISADIVAEPGAGGQALYESLTGDPELMDIENLTTEEFKKILELRPELAKEAGITAEQKPNDDGAGSAVVAEAAKLVAEATASKAQLDGLLNEMKISRSQELVKSLVAESRLPAKFRETIIAETADQVLTAEEVKAKIEHYRTLATTAIESVGGNRGLTAGMLIPFGTTVEMSSPLDQAMLALEDFFGIPDKEKAGKYGKINSFREFYRQVTGDYNIDGVYVKEQSALGDVWGMTFSEALPGSTHIVGGGTITMTNMLSATMNKALFNFYQEQPKWWSPIVQRETLNDMKTQTRIRLHNFGSLTERTVDGAEYTELDWSETAETYTPTEYGNVVTVGRRAIINDDLRGIRNIPRLMGWSATLTLNEYVSALFTANSGNGPTLTDGVQLFNAASHQSNRDTNVLNYTNLLAARKTTMAMLNDASKRIGLEAKWLLVPIDLEADAFSLLKSVRVPGSANNDPNILADGNRGMRDFITVPNWTNAQRWYTMCDPSQITGIELGFLYGREEPEFFTQDNPTVGMVFTNDAMAFKVRHDYGGDWVDYRAATGHIPS